MQYYANIPVCIFAISGSTLKIPVMEVEVLILVHPKQKLTILLCTTI